MKKVKLTIILLFAISLFYGQKNDLFKLTGAVKLLVSWDSNQKTPITFTSSTLDNFKIYHEQQGITLVVSYKNTSELLDQIGSSEGFIKVYEFNFDYDKDKEFIVFSRDSRNSSCRIFSKGLVKVIENFKSQLEGVAFKYFISTPHSNKDLATSSILKMMLS